MIYLVRHGETAFNAERRLQGHLDSPLTAQGIRQGQAIGAALRKVVNDGIEVETSPLGRARHTAEIIHAQLGVQSPLRIDERLREVSLGSWDGLTPDEIDAGWPGARGPSVRMSWIEGCPDGERYADVVARLKDWLGTVPTTVTRIVVCHGIAGSIVRGLYAGLSQAEMLRLPTPQDVVFVLDQGQIRTIDCPA